MNTVRVFKVIKLYYMKRHMGVVRWLHKTFQTQSNAYLMWYARYYLISALRSSPRDCKVDSWCQANA